MPTRGRSVLIAAAVGLCLTAAAPGGGSPAGPGAAEPDGARQVEVRPAASPVRGGVPGSRPNIVVVMADDMRADEMRFMPRTRRLLGDEGVEFVNSFSPYPLCCPARASFLSGRYTHNHGVWSNRPPYGFAAFDDSSTVATLLREAGYRTAFVGKYLNGYGTAPAPDGSTVDSLGYVPPGWVDWRGAVSGPTGWDAPEAGGTYRYFDTTLSVDGTLVGNPGRYQTTLLGDHSVDLLTELAADPRPFLLWSSYVAPHTGTPSEPDDPELLRRRDGTSLLLGTPARPRSVRGMYDHLLVEDPTRGEDPPSMRDKPFFVRDRPALTRDELDALATVARQRAESLHVLDRQVERTVTRLKELGVLDETMVVFVSDNGLLMGEHRSLQAKGLPYTPSLQVPTLLRGPGIPAGEQRRAPLLTIDLAPTFLALAGVSADPEMDGVSLLSVARGEVEDSWVRPVLTESGPRPPVLREGASQVLDRPQGPSARRFSQGVRTERYLYVEHASDERELYDLLRDPRELDNRADDPAFRTVVRRLAAILEELRSCHGDTCRPRLPDLVMTPASTGPGNG